MSFKLAVVYGEDLSKVRTPRKQTLQEMFKGAHRSTPVEEEKVEFSGKIGLWCRYNKGLS